MKESEYIKIRNLQRIETAKSLISNCLPDEIVDSSERAMVVKILQKWESKLYETEIKIDLTNGL